MKAKRIKISVDKEDVQNIINCYEKDIERIKQLEEVIKEARECIGKELLCYDNESDEYKCGVQLLEILSKGENDG